ncbi:MAG TPA: thiol peroxidase [Polyangiaceae bacterium]|nr:thiol peroxidase [Polyangiaceae bacterium]
MATTRFKGTPVSTSGELPAVGAQAPDFTLVAADLGEKTLASFAGKKKVLTINPSYDTGVCQATARRFNERLGQRGDAVALLVSADLPFAQARFCEAEGLAAAVPLSSFRSRFAADYGVELVDGPLRGLTARAVVVLDEKDVVRHVELVPEITTEPDYAAALAALG